MLESRLKWKENTNLIETTKDGGSYSRPLRKSLNHLKETENLGKLEAWAMYQTHRSPWQPYISFFRASTVKDSGYMGAESSHKSDRSLNELKILSLNAHSLLPKIESLPLLVKAEDLDVICVVETFQMWQKPAWWGDCGLCKRLSFYHSYNYG